MRVDFMMPSGPNAFLGFEDFSWLSAPHLPFSIILDSSRNLVFFLVGAVGGRRQTRTDARIVEAAIPRSTRRGRDSSGAGRTSTRVRY